MDMKKFRDLAITVLGAWLTMSPRLLHFGTTHVTAIWNTWLVGTAVILVIAVSRYLVDRRSPWEDLSAAGFGVWLMISPWVLGFATYGPEKTNSVIIGFVIATLSLWAMVVDADVRKWLIEWRHQHHHSG